MSNLKKRECPDGEEAQKMLKDMDDDELDEVFENPVVQGYLKKNGKKGNGQA